MKRTEEQAAAITNREPRICVAAGAGSGKTYVLVQRIVSLLEDGADFDGIVAITFTEKAAAEMKERLCAEFRRRAEAGDAALMTRWRDFERRLDTARVSTIHSFCMRLLKENALQLGIDPGFGLLSESQSRLLARDAVRETLIDRIAQGDPGVLALATERPFRSLSRMLIGLLPKAALIRRATRDWPRDDAAKLAAYWRERAGEVLLEEVQMPGAQRLVARMRSTLMGYAGRCGAPEKCGYELKRLFLLEQLDALATPPATAEALLAIGMREYPHKGKRGAPKVWDDEAAARSLKERNDEAEKLIASLCKLPEPQEPEIEERAATLSMALLGVLEALHQRLSEMKRRRNAMDFDDLIDRCAEALERNEAFRARAASDIQHLLMDEFQDTDHTQLGIAELLCGMPDGPNLFVVGDAKQSIYRFRGAEVEVFRKARERASIEFKLVKNFRSAASVLNFVNEFFQRSAWLCDVEPDYAALEPHRPAPAPHGVELLVPEDDGAKRDSAEAREREAALIARRIAAMCQGDGLIPDGNGLRPPRPGDFAILLRKMSNVHLYEEALRRAGIEYAVVAGAGFYERQEVLDLLNLFKVALDPLDEPALLAVLRGPFCALRDDTLALLCEHRTALPRAIAGDHVPDGVIDAGALANARQLLRDIHAHATLPVNQFMNYVLRRTHFEALLLGLPNGIQRASNLRKLTDLAETFAAEGNPSLRAFTAYLDDMRSALVRDGDALLQPQETGAVTIMTVHKSKGLEFPVVIVADASAEPEGRPDDVPSHRELGLVLTPIEYDVRNRHVWKEVLKRRSVREERDEHARLLYVALTRARDYLIVSGSPAPNAGSWLHMLDETLCFLDRPDGAALKGDGWTALVRRDAPEQRMPATDAASTDVDWEQLFERVRQPFAPPADAGEISISALLNLIESGLGDEEARFSGDDAGVTYGRDEAMERGVLAHRMMELWDFSGPPPIEEALNAATLEPEARERMREDLFAMARDFSATPLHAALAAAPSLLREHPFVLRIGTWLLRGTIDALLDGDTLVDYKTGRENDKKRERYRWQLLLYAAASQALTGRLPRRGVLVYLDEGRCDEFAITEADARDALNKAACMLSLKN